MSARSLVLATLCLAAPAVPAHALVPHRIVAVESTYVPGDIVILPGDTVTFTNLDLAPHDIKAIDVDPATGKRVFESSTAGPSQSVGVTGVETLTDGTYAFICSFHVTMIGTIKVGTS